MTRIDKTHTTRPNHSLHSNDSTAVPPTPATTAPKAHATVSGSDLANNASAPERTRTAEFAIRRKLEAHPEQADRFIADRLRGLNAGREEREIVAIVLARRGNTGLKRLADA